MAIFNVENLQGLTNNEDFHNAVQDIVVSEFDMSLFNTNFNYIAKRETSLDLNIPAGSPQWLYWFANKSTKLTRIMTGGDPAAIIPLNITHERTNHTINLLSDFDKLICSVLASHYKWRPDELINFMVIAEAGFLTTVCDDRHYGKLWPKYYGSHAFSLRKKGSGKPLFTLINRKNGEESVITYRK